MSIAEILGITENLNGSSGPLSRLETNVAASSLQYPFDLGSEYKKHWVKFEIKKLTNSSGSVTTDAMKVGEMAVSSLRTASEQIENKNYEAAITTVTNTFNKYTAKETLERTVSLYTPDSLEFSQSSHYNETSYAKMISDVGTAAGSTPIVGGAVKAVTGLFDPGDISKTVLSKMGYAFNPQLQLLFDGIDFRTYSMTFTFTPYSKKEADNITRIINTFRYYSAPTVASGAGGFFFELPAVFDIKFMSGSSTENQHINKVQRSVLESVQVNYAPNGWSAHNTGAPTQTTMVLNFKEISLLDRTKMEKA